MKVYVVKILVESIDINSCSVDVFDDIELARGYAKNEIYIYANDFDGEVADELTDYFTMQSGDCYVTIEVEEHEVNTKNTCA